MVDSQRVVRRLFFAGICCAALAACRGTLSSQPIPVDDGRRVDTWSGRVPPGPAKGIFFLNLTSQPIRVTAITLYDCVNVICDAVHPDNLILQPQDTVLGLTLLPLDPHARFDFRWKFVWRPAPGSFQVRATH